MLTVMDQGGVFVESALARLLNCVPCRWDSYFDMIQSVSPGLPWMVVAGNHEIEPNELTGHVMDPYKHR